MPGPDDRVCRLKQPLIFTLSRHRARNRHLKVWIGATALLNLLVGGWASGQGFTNLYQFTVLNAQFINRDGAYPIGGMVLLSNTLYGASSQGGTAAGGTVFKINTDGSGFGLLHSFTPANPVTGVPGDGGYPLGSLVVSGSTLYGTTSSGGPADNGTVFKVNLDGSGFATLYAFGATDLGSGTNSDGAEPWTGVLLSAGTLYGAASRGGNAGSGTIFKMNTDGSGFTRLYSFSALDPTTQTNSDGAYPLGGLVLSGNALYGTAYRGGALGTGTVFRVGIDGAGFTVLHHADGGPRAALLLSSNVLYGTTEAGGSAGGGTVFKLNTDGTGFSSLQNFAGAGGDGPWGGLILSGGTLYGTTFGGGAGQGSVFSMNPNGTGFANVYSFTGGSDGAQPQAALIVSGGKLYGAASAAGDSGSGTIFAVAPGQTGGQGLSITLVGGSVVLMWPTAATGVTLQSSPNLVGPLVWTPVSPPPIVINGQNVVTNPISGGQMFYQLK